MQKGEKRFPSQSSDIPCNIHQNWKEGKKLVLKFLEFWNAIAVVEQLVDKHTCQELFN